MTKNPLGAVRRALAFLLILTMTLPVLAAETEPKVKTVQAPESIEVLVNKQRPLPQDYRPELKALPPAYGGYSMRPEAADAFVEMAQAAAQDGFALRVVSGYRSYGRQTTIYQNYRSQYGAATADTFSARPGFSEHQTGLAADINTASTRAHFENTATFRWLEENCWDYGFILRYPQDKEAITGYRFEPWHYRYVGVETALAVKESGLTYDEYAEQKEAQPITRAQLADTLYKLAGENARSPYPQGYQDLEGNAEYLPGVAWALDQKLMAGVASGRFDPEGDVSQSYLAVVLYRLAQPEGFSAKTALNWAVESELMALPADEDAPVTQWELGLTLRRLEEAMPEEELIVS